MGLRYILFRLFFEIKCRTGLLKRAFPTMPKQQQFFTLEEWKQDCKPFVLSSRETLSFPLNESDILAESAKRILDGEIQFFNYIYLKVDDWLTNPDSGHKYSNTKHWTEINDYNPEAGDIKYVWEKSRFSYLHTIIRYDFHFQQDNSKFVFDEIDSWISSNTINQGPNYKCSQEISLRILNWIFALYFYKNSRHLTEKLFQKIIHNIYWQLHHVYRNINFSRIAVRNNHAITETLTLYIVSTLFPQFPNAEKWKHKGKKWFEQEIKYQVYEDGTFLQFSMNYHRVVVQLLTWAIKIADLNDDKFIAAVYDRAYNSVNFLFQCQENSNGHLPNYGANDGALFFKLSNNDYRDYRPQLDALHMMLTGSSLYTDQYEDSMWYGKNVRKCRERSFAPLVKQMGIVRFDKGGYYLFRENETLTFIRCGNHKDRPSQADNLHIDIWHKGENILLDGGSFKYNTTPQEIKYFMGTESHNTIMLDNYDQMQKGSRFVWYHWTQKEDISIKEENDCFLFEGTITAFRYLGNQITHKRIVKKSKGLISSYNSD